jgi:hypothetical protein
MLRIIFEQKISEETARWRKLHDQELHNVHSSPSNIRIIKLRRMRCVEHVA